MLCELDSIRGMNRIRAMPTRTYSGRLGNNSGSKGKVMNFKKSIIRSTLAVLAVAASMLASPGASAMDIVLDPWNLTQNVTTAAQSVLTEIYVVRQYQQMLRSNLAGLSGNQFTNTMQQLGQLNSLMNAAQSLKQSLGVGANAVQNIQSLYGASNYPSFQSFTSSLAQRKAAGDADANNLINAAYNATSEIQSAEVAHQQVVNSLSGVAGPTEAAQATAAAVGTLVEQNQAFLGTLASMAQDQGMQRAKESQADADATSMAAAREQANAASLAALKANPALNWK
jgi:hypothetical protein